MLSLLQALFNIFCYVSQKEEAVRGFVEGKDVFAILPTGYGKSVIYAILPLLFDFMFGKFLESYMQCVYYVIHVNEGRTGSIVVVITPLIALMVDQKKNFSPTGVTVEFVGKAQDDNAAVKRVLKGEVQLVYISPENILKNHRFRDMLLKTNYQQRLVAVVVDEAHCVQMW